MLHDAIIDIRAMVALWMGKDAGPMGDSAGLWIIRAIVNGLYPGGCKGGGAHGAGLQRDKQTMTGQPL